MARVLRKRGGWAWRGLELDAYCRGRQWQARGSAGEGKRRQRRWRHWVAVAAVAVAGVMAVTVTGGSMTLAARMVAAMAMVAMTVAVTKEAPAATARAVALAEVT